MDSLHADERALITKGRYQPPKHLVGSRNFLQLDRVTVPHGKHNLVNNLSLTVFDGEVFVLVGENGSGKSAILNTLAGLQHKVKGSAKAYGYDLFKAYKFLSDNFLSFCEQEPVLIDMMTAEQHIEFIGKIMCINNLKATTDRILAQFNLQDCADIVAVKLNTIQRKRLMFALSLLGNTKIVLLDEPTQGMDIASRRLIWSLIRAEKRNRIMIVSTQNMEEAVAIGDRIGLISHGSLKMCGPPRFFDHKVSHSVKLQFTLPARRATVGRKGGRLESLVNEAISPAYRDNV